MLPSARSLYPADAIAPDKVSQWDTRTSRTSDAQKQLQLQLQKQLQRKPQNHCYRKQQDAESSSSSQPQPQRRHRLARSPTGAMHKQTVGTSRRRRQELAMVQMTRRRRQQLDGPTCAVSGATSTSATATASSAANGTGLLPLSANGLPSGVAPRRLVRARARVRVPVPVPVAIQVNGDSINESISSAQLLSEPVIATNSREKWIRAALACVASRVATTAAAARARRSRGKGKGGGRSRAPALVSLSIIVIILCCLSLSLVNSVVIPVANTSAVIGPNGAGERLRVGAQVERHSSGRRRHQLEPLNPEISTHSTTLRSSAAAAARPNTTDIETETATATETKVKVKVKQKQKQKQSQSQVKTTAERLRDQLNHHLDRAQLGHNDDKQDAFALPAELSADEPRDERDIGSADLQVIEQGGSDAVIGAGDRNVGDSIQDRDSENEDEDNGGDDDDDYIDYGAYVLYANESAANLSPDAGRSISPGDAEFARAAADLASGRSPIGQVIFFAAQQAQRKKRPSPESHVHQVAAPPSTRVELHSAADDHEPLPATGRFVERESNNRRLKRRLRPLIGASDDDDEDDVEDDAKWLGRLAGAGKGKGAGVGASTGEGGGAGTGESRLSEDAQDYANERGEQLLATNRSARLEHADGDGDSSGNGAVPEVQVLRELNQEDSDEGDRSNQRLMSTTDSANTNEPSTLRGARSRNSTGGGDTEESPLAPNKEDEDAGTKQHTVYYWRLIWFVLPVGATFGNLLVIMAVYRERNLQSVTNYFIVSLAFSDLFVGLIVMPFAVYVLVNGVWELSDTICDIYVAVDVTSSTASILNLVAISIDRYRAVAYPIAYTASSSSTIAILTICGVWLISCAVGAPIIFGLNTTPGRKSSLCILYNSTFIFWSSLASFYIPCIAMTILYWRIFSAIRSRTKKAIQGHHRNTNNNTNNQQHQQQQVSASAAIINSVVQQRQPMQKPLAITVGDQLITTPGAAQHNTTNNSSSNNNNNSDRQPIGKSHKTKAQQQQQQQQRSITGEPLTAAGNGGTSSDSAECRSSRCHQQQQRQQQEAPCPLRPGDGAATVDDDDDRQRDALMKRLDEALERRVSRELRRREAKSSGANKTDQSSSPAPSGSTVNSRADLSRHGVAIELLAFCRCSPLPSNSQSASTSQQKQQQQQQPEQVELPPDLHCLARFLSRLTDTYQAASVGAVVDSGRKTAAWLAAVCFALSMRRPTRGQIASLSRAPISPAPLTWPRRCFMEIEAQPCKYNDGDGECTTVKRQSVRLLALDSNEAEAEAEAEAEEEEEEDRSNDDNNNNGRCDHVKGLLPLLRAKLGALMQQRALQLVLAGNKCRSSVSQINDDGDDNKIGNTDASRCCCCCCRRSAICGCCEHSATSEIDMLDELSAICIFVPSASPRLSVLHLPRGQVAGYLVATTATDTEQRALVTICRRRRRHTVSVDEEQELFISGSLNGAGSAQLECRQVSCDRSSNGLPMATLCAACRSSCLMGMTFELAKTTTKSDELELIKRKAANCLLANGSERLHMHVRAPDADNSQLEWDDSNQVMAKKSSALKLLGASNNNNTSRTIDLETRNRINSCSDASECYHHIEHQYHLQNHQHHLNRSRSESASSSASSSSSSTSPSPSRSSESTNFQLDGHGSASDSSLTSPEYACSTAVPDGDKGDNDAAVANCCRRRARVSSSSARSRCATCDRRTASGAPFEPVTIEQSQHDSTVGGATNIRPRELATGHNDAAKLARQLEPAADSVAPKSEVAAKFQVTIADDSERDQVAIMLTEQVGEKSAGKAELSTGGLFQSTAQSIKRRSMRLSQLIRGRRSPKSSENSTPNKVAKKKAKQYIISDEDDAISSSFVDQAKKSAKRLIKTKQRHNSNNNNNRSTTTSGGQATETLQSPIEGIKSCSDQVFDTTSAGYGESEIVSRLDSSGAGFTFGTYKNLSAAAAAKLTASNSNASTKCGANVCPKDLMNKQFLWNPQNEMATTIDPSSSSAYSSSAVHKPGPSYLVSTVVNLMQRMPSVDEPDDKQKQRQSVSGALEVANLAPNAATSKGSKSTDPRTSIMQPNNRMHRVGSRRKREKNAARRERKATKTLAIVLGVFLICWTPFFTCNIIDGICIQLDMDCRPGMMVYLVTSWLGYINSCVNPIIYTIFNMEFRRAFKKILTTSPKCCAG